MAVDVDGRALDEAVDGTALHPVPGDVRDAATATRAVDAAAGLGDLTALVNDAGLALDRAFGAHDDESWRTVVDTLLEGTRVMCRAVAEAMRAAAGSELADGGDPRPRRITTTVPATTLTATAGGSASAAAGGAVAALTRSLARELGPHGIRVNGVVVGYAETRATQALPEGVALASPDAPGLPEPVRQMAAATTALGRFARPEEIAAVHAFLCSADASYVTGALVPATGGLLGT